MVCIDDLEKKLAFCGSRRESNVLGELGFEIVNQVSLSRGQVAILRLVKLRLTLSYC